MLLQRFGNFSYRTKMLLLLVLTGYLIFSVVNTSTKILGSKSTGKSVAKKTELELHQNLKYLGRGIEHLPKDATLREQLSFHFPYYDSKPIPNKIWQTWKTDEKDENFPKNFKNFALSWKTNNPKLNHQVIPDSATEELMIHLYQQVPAVLKLYQLLPKNILKADFFRYLILYARGGTYSDIDTLSLKPVDEWITFNKTINGLTNNAGLVLGIEADPDRPDWAEWYARRIQFCQWTIQAKLGHPLLRELIVAITELTMNKLNRGTLKSVEGKNAGGDIMNWTGPGIFTDVIFLYINNVYTNGKDQEVIDWKYFTGMRSPILIDDVLVLPITSFSPGVGQMGAETETHPLLYVKHMFEGSWKPENERKIGNK